MPGALLAAVTYMGATTVSEFLLGYWVTDNGRLFGSFGIVLALLAWGQVLAGIWVTCGIFSPVYAEWREGWKRTGASPFPGAAIASLRPSRRDPGRRPLGF